MKVASTVVNPVVRSDGHDDLQFGFPIHARHAPYQAARGSTNYVVARSMERIRAQEVEKLLSRAIVRTIDNARATLHWPMNLPFFVQPMSPTSAHTFNWTI
jgi:hypothetical protein